MKKRILSLLLALLLCIAMAVSASAEEGYVDGDQYKFTDREGNFVTVPVSAFASRVVEFIPGSPWRTGANTDPVIALGLPDADDSNSSTGDLCLGINGVLVLAFDAPIYDGEGDDIYIFEVGGYVEETRVEVSEDMVTWYDIGVAEGRTAGLDFKDGEVPTSASILYVRLTDTGNNPAGDWPGADIDAVCGLNTKPAVERDIDILYASTDNTVSPTKLPDTEDDFYTEVRIKVTGESADSDAILVLMASFAKDGRFLGIKMVKLTPSELENIYNAGATIKNDGSVEKLSIFVMNKNSWIPLTAYREMTK
ncbi:MAG: hypothetical protein IJG50_05210 [Clostridia bacterium]|nr:hypothetical protein [Clostridia bacterium]